MNPDLLKKFYLFMRYFGWLAIYGALFLIVSFPAAWILDHAFPESFYLTGPPMSFYRLCFVVIWLSIVTVLVWPLWHWLGDFFLPNQNRFLRFKEMYDLNREVTKLLQEERKHSKTEPSGSANPPSAGG